MATVTYDSDAPGRGGSGPLFSGGSRVMKVVTGSLAFDSSYPTGGEALDEVFALFNDQSGVSRLNGIIFDQPLSGSQTGKFIKVDYTNKKAQLFTNASPAVEVANASDQSAITALRFIAWGPRK
jgi:hypothetical protein